MSANLARSSAHYRGLAPRYDHYTRRIDRIRERAIEALALVPGESVLDAGCGTGWCLPQLARRVGAGGRVLGFDASPEMLAIARTRMHESGAAPVTLILANAQAAQLPVPVDAILFSFTHDLLRSGTALANVLRQARPGARVVATGTKLFARWLLPANWYLRYSHREYITDFEGLAAPWSLLAQRLDDFRVTERAWTPHYIATGRVRAA